VTTKILLSASAFALGLVGLAATFLPAELLAASGAASGAATGAATAPLLVQVLGALALGFAMLNWMNRTQTIGGIYGRPVAFANALQFTAGALALVKGAMAGARDPLTLGLAAAWSLFALLFLRLMFTHPSAPPRS